MLMMLKPTAEVIGCSQDGRLPLRYGRYRKDDQSVSTAVCCRVILLRPFPMNFNAPELL